MSLRTYRLDAAREAVLKAAKFRKPQRASFEAVHNLVHSLDDDLPKISADRLLEQLREHGLNVPKLPADLVFELATGVGKTRLMGALIAYLFRSGQSKNALILAPRTAILEKLERESQVGSAKYLLLDPALVPEPNLCFRGNIDSFQPDPERLNLYVLSPQTITGSDKRFARPGDYRKSLLEMLRETPDLVVYVDESHHLQGRGKAEATAWKEAVDQLEPRLQFGFTATPLAAGDSNILHSYDLAECLRDGLYTKAVKVWVETAPTGISEDDWDKSTLDFGLQRLERKRGALRAFADEYPDKLSFIEPVMLVSARDTEHADAIAGWLKDKRGLGEDEIHIAHSHRQPSEEELGKLIAVDKPGNRIRVVVNVFQLSEGWDVTNVYVVAPLRAMATYQNAIQSMGRGLRLPAGRRVEDPELDTLDVLCFGRETFERIVEQATQQFGRGPDGAATVTLATPDSDQTEAEATKVVDIALRIDIKFEIPGVRRVPPEPVLDFDITKAPEVQVVSGIDLVSLDRFAADDDVLKYTFEAVVRNATLRIISDLPYLSPAVHYEAVEKLVAKLLIRLGATETDEVAVDPIKVAMLVETEINRRYLNQPVTFELVGSPKTVTPGAYGWRVAEDFAGPISKDSVTGWQ